MGKSHAKRKAEIIASTLTLAAENGVKKVTTQAIADHIGIAQATVFRHFKSRDAIFSESIEWLAGQLFTTISSCFSEKTAADERLNTLIERQLKFISQHKGLPRVLFSDRLHIESPALRGVVQKVLTRYIQQVAALVEDGMVAGHFKADIDSKQTAKLIAALIQGTVMRWSIFNFNFELVAEAPAIQAFVRQSICLSLNKEEINHAK